LGSGRIDFYRTFVQPADRGRHLAHALVDTGLAWARQQQFEISASCWYVQKVLQRQRKHREQVNEQIKE
ncbi:MAG: N-acetyltransferase, partial [Pseudomonadales bacterium]|nr:N-acetyltransferase [Pseudomonadales bacterium]